MSTFTALSQTARFADALNTALCQAHDGERRGRPGGVCWGLVLGLPSSPACSTYLRWLWASPSVRPLAVIRSPVRLVCGCSFLGPRTSPPAAQFGQWGRSGSLAFYWGNFETPLQVPAGAGGSKVSPRLPRPQGKTNGAFCSRWKRSGWGE